MSMGDRWEQTRWGFSCNTCGSDGACRCGELGQLAQTDHAYIYRLEQGEKGAPSEDVLLRLIRALKGERREAEMLRFLAAHPETAQDLVVEVLKDPTVTYEVFAAAAGAAFRGTARPNYARLLARVRRILSEENGNG